MVRLTEDTIAAIATARGRGAIGIVRVSGPTAHEIGKRIVDRWPEKPGYVVVTGVRNDPGDELVDRCIVVRFDAPHSYTGEDAFELQCHGGVTSPAAVLRCTLRAGAREAWPGEFTQRAFMAGKVDLVQAEAIAELIDAQTDASRRLALQNSEGRLSNIVQRLQQQLIHVEALLAYGVDFPEEDDGPQPRSAVGEAATEVLALLRRLLSTTTLAEVAQRGATVVIAGAPNVGKSSLFNALIGDERAIVTEHPGTTRDAIEAVLDDAELPLRIVDTAGLRETQDSIEQRGIEMSRRHLVRAQLVLVCGETLEEIALTEEQLPVQNADVRVLRVLTKADLHPAPKSGNVLSVSARDHLGLDQLVATVRNEVREIVWVDAGTPVVTQERHRNALRGAEQQMLQFLRVWEERMLPDVVAAVHVHGALHSLREIVGTIDTEAILGAVFERFCVGK